MWGQSIAAPNTSVSPQAAEDFAFQFLADNIGVLAPGCSVIDFAVVSNQTRRGIRTVGLAQHVDGYPVIGGQVSMRFKANRLVMVAGEAYPNVPVFTWYSPQTKHDVRANIETALQSKSLAWNAGTTLAVLPIVSEKHVEYRPVRVDEVVDTAAHTRFTVYIDVRDGSLVGQQSQNLFAEAPLHYIVPERYPGAGYTDYAAARVQANVDGVAQVAGPDGVVTFTGPTASIETSVIGELVEVVNVAGERASTTLTASDGTPAMWDESADEFNDAQLTTYVHTNIVKEFIREFAPDLLLLDGRMTANVNIDESCNAFFDGQSINFYRSSASCDNTGRLADVVYHEFGHAFHRASLIEGVGRFDGAFSEGMSDFLAILVTEDPGMGRGFRYSENPLRDANPVGVEPSWPQDIGEIHKTGVIYASAMWDLWDDMRTSLGPEIADPLVKRYMQGAAERSSDIPTAFLETLLEDDDDGNLSNGTPNICAISSAFGKHGLRFANIDVSALTAEAVSPTGHQVAATVNSLAGFCPGEEIVDVRLQWRQRTGGEGDFLSMDGQGGTYEVNIPAQPENTVVRYQIEVFFNDGSRVMFPQNPADPWFEFYVGEVVPIYCTSFETSPWEEGWSHGIDLGVDEWQWGAPSTSTHSDDPPSAHDGTSAVGVDLGIGEGFDRYYEPKTVSFLTSPLINVGNYSDVRLQYFRWLNVEDGFYDDARIKANGRTVWENNNSDNGSSSAIHHRDAQWTFHDVPISPQLRGPQFNLQFELSTDPGLELGGWTIDSLCIVANPTSICGDGEVSSAEECDNGGANANVADSCRQYCRLPACGDGVLDSGEGCDDGNNVDGDGCDPLCVADSDKGTDFGCSARSESLPGALLVSLALLALARRRRYVAD
ncbi:MAG: hypothetical protein KDA60_15430 [Planctomycetales bacterium]|nr:hypothetical protein [Planctomycetales bacterium]